MSLCSWSIACSFPDWNREWTHCCGRGWIVTGWMMCSLASCRKGKHMCARSIVNKLNCWIPQWPDVMDKCQTNALTPLLEQPREKKKTVRSVIVGKTEPQLHVMNVFQGTHKTLQEHMHVGVYWYSVPECEIETWAMPAVKLVNKTTSLSEMGPERWSSVTDKAVICPLGSSLRRWTWAE